MRGVWTGSIRAVAVVMVGTSLCVPADARGQGGGALPRKGELTLPDEQAGAPRFRGAAIPFDVDALANPPSAGENAAPLYIDALSDLGPELSHLFPPAARDAASQELSARSKELSDLSTRLSKNPAGVSTDELRNALGRYAGVLEKVRAAQKRPSCMFLTGFDIFTLLPHVQAARGLARLLDLEIELAARDGRVDAAIDDLAMLLRLSDDLRPRGMMIVQLVATEIEGVGARSALRIVNAPAATSKQIDRLIAVLVDHLKGRPDPIVIALQSEYLVQRRLLEQVATDPRGLLQSLETAATELMIDVKGGSGRLSLDVAKVIASMRGGDTLIEELEREVVKLQGRGGLEAAVSMLNRKYQALAKLAGGKPGEETRSLPGRMQAASRSNAVPVADVLDGLSQPSFPLSMEQGRASVEAAIGAALVRRYFFDHNMPPPIGEGLAPFVAAVPGAHRPIDPYTGDLLRLAFLGQRLVVYSVGPDGKDDGGAVADLNPQTVPPSGDLVFPTMP